jgi:hypothetical protein
MHREQSRRKFEIELVEKRHALDMQRIEAERRLEEQLPPSAVPQKHKGGPPAKYDWEAFYIEVARIADTDGLPSRYELYQRMLAWTVDNWGREPSESVFREKIAKLYDRIGPR